KLRMTIDVLNDAIVVPEHAVSETQAGPVVYLVDDEGKVAVQSVEAAQTYQGLRIVAAGLEAGRQVIVEGLQLVRPGIDVKVEPAILPAPVSPESGLDGPVEPPGTPAPAGGAPAAPAGEEPDLPNDVEPGG